MAMRGQRHHRDRADLLQREIQINKVEPVRQLQHQPVARTNAEIEQIKRQIRRSAVERLVGDWCMTIDHRNARGMATAHLLPHRGYRTSFPMTLRTLACAKFRRTVY